MSYPVYAVYAGDVLPIFFSTYAGATGASATMTGLAVTDVEIYKDGSVTQRASDAGYVLLDTDGIDFDGITGIHGFSIDTGDNTDASFYTVGAWFHVVVSAVTVDSQTVNFIAAAFRILAAEAIAGKPKVDVDAWLGTAASTPTVAGVPNVNTKTWNDLTTVALPLVPTTAGRTLGVSAANKVDGVVLVDTLTTYTGNTVQTGDSFARIGAAGAGLTNIDLPNQTMDITGSLSGSVGSVTGAVGSVTGAVGSVTGAVGSVTGNVGGNVTGSVGSIAAGGIASTSFAASAITAASLAADAGAEIADAVWDEDATGHQTQGTFGQAIGDPVADTNTLFKAVVTDATGATVGVDVVDLKTQVGTAGAGLTAIDLPNQTMDITGSLSGSVGSVTGAVGSVTGAVGSVTGAVGSVTGNVGGNVTGSVGSVATGGIAAASFAAGAIDAAAIAADAIGSSELAASAVTEIQSGLATSAAVAALNNLSAAQVNAEVVDALATDVLADSVATDGSRPTIAQAIYMLVQFMCERSVSSTTMTVKKVDGSTSLMTFTLNDATTPTSITRTT